MTVFTALPFAAAILSLLLAVASVVRKKPSFATWCFFAGMAVLGVDSLFTGLSLRSTELPDAIHWLTLALTAKSFAPAAWLGFSLTYSRGDYRASLTRWRIPLAILALLPIVLSLGFSDQFVEVVKAGPAGEMLQLRFGAVAKALNVVLLVAFALVLMNLEQTFRSAAGTMRWRIKFVVLGLAVIFGAHLYVRSQAILFSSHDLALSSVESSGLLLGCLFLAIAYVRTGLDGADVYPSRAVLRSSITVLVVGGYLFVVGVLAQLVGRLGGAGSFQVQTFVVLLGMAGLALLLLSDRFRHRVRTFVGRHFARAQHDSVRVWAGFSQQLANVKDEAGLWAASARFISETFDALSTTAWLVDEGKEQLVCGASTTRQSRQASGEDPPSANLKTIAAGLRARSAPFDLDAVNGAWADALRRLNPATFPVNGGHRYCVPLAAGGQVFGAIVLADRVGGAAYTGEELDLLKCIGDQVTSVLMNLRLANEVVQAREMEAFRTMSAFFVHDLKNAAASLNLMLKNLAVHFDNPAFREDALRGVGNTARRIDEMIARLSALRQGPDFRAADTDLSQLVAETVNGLDDLRGVALTMELRPLPAILADREQVRSVVTNLLLNARDALGGEGRVVVRTEQRGDRVVLSVEDNGCGMSEAFVRDALFRPFRSTKKHGLGIGMFQSRMIVERHGGSIQVESEPGKGTTVRVGFPVRSAP